MLLDIYTADGEITIIGKWFIFISTFFSVSSSKKTFLLLFVKVRNITVSVPEYVKLY